jgi:ATP-dependent helicase/nuclease subunit A
MVSAEELDPDLEREEVEHPWRATGPRQYVPARVVGRLVHVAVQRGELEDEARLKRLLEGTALQERLVDAGQRARAVEHARGLVHRLRDHPLWARVQRAQERFQEIHYTRWHPHDRADSGRIDLLIREREGWVVVDFKTDALESEEELQQVAESYSRQMQQYGRAVEALLGGWPDLLLCFLDCAGEVRVVPVSHQG